MSKRRVCKRRSSLQVGRATLSAPCSLDQQHVVHRDIKPSNIVLGTDGLKRLIDFGLAKRMDAERDHSLTRYATWSGLIVASLLFLGFVTYFVSGGLWRQKGS